MILRVKTVRRDWASPPMVEGEKGGTSWRMLSALKLYQRLRVRYNYTLSFKRICADEGIEVQVAPLDDGIHAMYIRANGYCVILISSGLSKAERRDWSWHELFHHFTSSGDGNRFALKQEHEATLFAAFCRIPSVHWGDTIVSIVERYQVSPWLAKARLEYEIKKLNAWS